MTAETISVCLPKGDALEPLAGQLEKLAFPVFEYHSKNRTYRPEVKNLPVRAKIMAEKDVAIQVAVGNYDIGFCGMDWIKEHTIRYRASKIFVYKDMGIYKKKLFACTGIGGNLKSIEDLKNKDGFVTIISEYPNLAEDFAIRTRLKKFKIFSAWGSVEAYPPEHADVVILATYNPESFLSMGLLNISCELESALFMVLNRQSLMKKNLSPVLSFFKDMEAS